MDEHTFYDDICSRFTAIDKQLRSSKSRQEFVNEFKELFSSSQAKNAKGVIYFWRSQEDVPRVRGKSYVLYIGRAKQSLNQRHHRYAKTESNDYNLPRYEYILENFGPITVHYADPKSIACDLKEAEAQMLSWYFEFHCEYPPLSRASR